jgi:hypothetical protein
LKESAKITAPDSSRLFDCVIHISDCRLQHAYIIITHPHIYKTAVYQRRPPSSICPPLLLLYRPLSQQCLQGAQLAKIYFAPATPVTIIAAKKPAVLQRSVTLIISWTESHIICNLNNRKPM